MIKRIGKKVNKNNQKAKKRQLSMTDIPDFKLECGKMFIVKFSYKVQISDENCKPF